MTAATNGARPRLSPRIVNAIAGVVTVIWAASFTADMVIRDYDPSANVHMAFMLVIGTIFGSSFIRKEG